jgi:hypothetical protein
MSIFECKKRQGNRYATWGDWGRQPPKTKACLAKPSEKKGVERAAPFRSFAHSVVITRNRVCFDRILGSTMEKGAFMYLRGVQ